MGQSDLPECESVRQFLRGFHTDATKESYSKKLAQFVRLAGTTPDALLELALTKPKSVQNMIIDHIEERKKQVSGSTIHQTVAALKHFFEMNDAEDSISWSKIAKISPKSKKTGSDRAPTTDEVRQMLQASDTRIRCIILVCSSSGIRVGGFEGLRWGDVKPIRKDSQVLAAKVVVYRGSPEEYITFVTPECYEALLQYMDARRKAGENITKSSPLIRDSWDSHLYRKYKSKNPATPSPVSAKTIANMMGTFLRRTNIRDASGGMHEFKQVHGFRKYFKTNAERSMKTIDVEKLMGHAENYYKPSEEYLLEQYARAVPDLTISKEEELKRAVQSQAIVSDKKVGEIERENASLQDRLDQLESKYGSLKDILEDVLLAKTK